MLEDGDLDALFEWESDPRAVEMAAKVLVGAGFVEVGSETAFAPGLGADVVERIYRLDR